MPRVGVMPTKHFPGANNLPIEEGVRALLIVSWAEVWTTPWDTDAHLVTYYVANSAEDRWPRCNKALLPKLRALSPPADIHTRLLVLDFDNPHHAAWTEDSLSDWLERLAAAADDEPLAWAWNVLYTTTHGARLVYVLDEAIPVDQAEEHHRWLCQQLREAGVRIDDIDALGYLSSGREAPARFPTSDWTRCFRLPFVMRDRQPTWEAPIFEFLEQPDQFLLVEDLGVLEGKVRSPKGRVTEIREPKPDLVDALDLLSEINGSTGREVQSLFFREARKRLQGRECFDCLFRHRPLAPTGSRDSTIMRYVGEAATLLYRMEDDSGNRLTTPAHLFGLFLDPVFQLEPDADTPDWTDVLWKAVLYCWAREEAEETLRVEEAAAKEQDVLDALGSIVEGMRQWCDDPRLHGTDAEAKEFAAEHLICTLDRTNYVMRRDGWYDGMGVGMGGLIPRIRALDMGDVIQFKVPSKDGKSWRTLGAQELVNEYGTVVDGITGIPQDQDKGGFISSIDQWDATLHAPLYSRRTDVPPVYHAEVAAWLKAFFPEGHYEEGCNWIAHALAVEDGPICALSIKGEAGAGKKLLALGLGECFSRRMVAGGEELVDKYQHMLLQTPVVHVDEGWPRSSSNGGKHPADMFRELVGGGARNMDRKYRAPVNARNPVRVVLTANNLGVVQVLFAGRDMSPEDRNAIALRILHYDIGDRASKHLRRLGGIEHTEGWIPGDGGKGSREIVAQHFFWLYENMRLTRGQRLLVEGNGHGSLMTVMRTQSGSAPVVVEALIRMIEQKVKRFDGMVIEEGRLYVLTSEVLEYFRAHLAKNVSERLTANRIGQVFKGLVVSRTHSRELETRKDMGKVRWHEIDLRILQRVARNDGWQCGRLDALIAEQVKRGIINADEDD